MSNYYKIHYQHLAFKVAARDEREAYHEARKTLGLPDGEAITVIKDEHPSGREQSHMNLITCPYCGHEDQDSWEFGGRQEEPLEVECGECERAFIVTMYVEVTYTSIPKEIDQ